MTIYVDGLFLLNTALNGLLLLGTARLGGAAVVWWRIVLGAALGGGYAVAALVLPWPAVSGMAGKLLSAAAMTVCAFGFRRQTVKLGGVFLALSAALAGVVLAVVEIMGTGLMLVDGGAYYPVSGKALLLTAAAVYVLSRTVFAQLVRHTGGEVFPLELRSGSKAVKLTALRDTGNTLRDPVTNEEVVVAEWQTARGLLPPEAAALVDAAALRNPAELLPRLLAAMPSGKWRLIPFRAVGVSGGMLVAMRCDALRIGKRTVRGGVVAFSPTPVSDGGGYTALIGGSI